MTKCLVCGALHDCNTDINGNAKPKPGDFALCNDCGTICVFDNDLNIRRATRVDLMELAKVQPLTFAQLRKGADLITNRILKKMMKNN